MPFYTGKELEYLSEVVGSDHVSGNGRFTKECQAILRAHSGAKKCLLTTSCTDALEMSSILAEISPGDEVIVPSYTFVSSANAFVLHGAKIVFADSRADHPGMNEDELEGLITEKTKVVVVVHYAGVACDMEKISAVAKRHNLIVVEDAAQSVGSHFIDSSGSKKALGSIGHLGTYSFHETKNIHCGEGGALLVNDDRMLERAEIIWEKGTNRAAFWRGEVDKYGWVDVGSSFLPSELLAAFLLAQLERIEEITSLRMKIWESYYAGLKSLFENGTLRGPSIPSYATNNAHMFYLVCNDLNERTALISALKDKGINAVFHYQALHRSGFAQHLGKAQHLPWAEEYSDRLVRLPLHPNMNSDQVSEVIEEVRLFHGLSR